MKTRRVHRLPPRLPLVVLVREQLTWGKVHLRLERSRRKHSFEVAVAQRKASMTVTLDTPEAQPSRPSRTRSIK